MADYLLGQGEEGLKQVDNGASNAQRQRGQKLFLVGCRVPVCCACACACACKCLRVNRTMIAEVERLRA